MAETRTALPCCCLPAQDDKPARRSLACPQHGCTCGTGRAARPEHRGALDGSCPTHGDLATPRTRTITTGIPPLDPVVLSQVDLQILDLEKHTFKYTGAKDREAAEIMGGRYTGVTPTLYYQRLNQLLDHPAALAAEPVLIARLRAQREDY